MLLTSFQDKLIDFINLLQQQDNDFFPHHSFFIPEIVKAIIWRYISMVLKERAYSEMFDDDDDDDDESDSKLTPIDPYNYVYPDEYLDESDNDEDAQVPDGILPKPVNPDDFDFMKWLVPLIRELAKLLSQAKEKSTTEHKQSRAEDRFAHPYDYVYPDDESHNQNSDAKKNDKPEFESSKNKPKTKTDIQAPKNKTDTETFNAKPGIEDKSNSDVRQDGENPDIGVMKWLKPLVTDILNAIKPW